MLHPDHDEDDCFVRFILQIKQHILHICSDKRVSAENASSISRTQHLLPALLPSQLAVAA